VEGSTTWPESNESGFGFGQKYVARGRTAARLAWYKMENGKMVTAQTGMSATVVKNDAVDAWGTFLPCRAKGDSSGALMVRVVVVAYRIESGTSVRAAATPLFVERQKRLRVRLLLLLIPIKDCTSVRLASNTVAMKHQRIACNIFLMVQIFAVLSTSC
jgi:hypothetical protein